MKKALKSVVALVFCFMILSSTAVFSSAISAVTNLKATNVIYNSATLTWSKVKNADGYQVRPYVDKKYGTTVDNKKETTYKAKLTPGKSYYFYVRAYDKKLKGFKYVYEYSSWQKVAVKAVPAKVTGLKATQSGTTVKLSWTKVPSITGYVVQQYKNGKYTNIKTLSYKYTSLNVAKQPYGSTQQFRVVAYVKYNSKNIYGSYSSAAKVTLATKAPTGVKVDTVTASSGNMNWSSVTGATGYQLYRYSSSKKAYVKVVTTTKTAYNVTGLYAATEYKFKVRSYVKYNSAVTYSSWSSVYAFTTLPKTIEGIKLSDMTDTSCKISWTASKTAPSYQLYKYDYSTAKWTKVANTTNTSLSVTGLKPNSRYGFKVRGYVKIEGKYYYTAYSSILRPYTKMAAPVITSTYDGTRNEYNLSWKAVSGATEYVLERYNNSNYTWDEIARGAERTFTDKNNVVRSAVLYRVRAFNSKGEESMPAKGTTASTSLLTVTKDAYSATVTWGDVENYNVKDGVNVEKKINKYTILTKPINKHNDVARPWFTTATITSTDLDSFKFNLTPGAVNSFMIYAWEEGSSVPYTLGPIDVDADDLTVNTTDNSKTAQVLNYINAVNKTKAETGKLTVKNSTTATMNLEALLIDGDIETGESNAATALWNVISGDGVITGEEIQDFLELAEKLGVIEEEEIPEINKTEKYTETLVFENGIAKTENGTKNLRLYIEPSSSYIDGSKVGLAYLYDQHNAAAWKNGFSSVSTSYYSDGRIKFTATLKQEKFGTSVNKAASLYHPGLVSTIDSGSLSSSANSVNELTTVGATTITAVINTDGTLNSLTVKSPFETKFFESAGEGLSLGMEMSGSTNTSYTFTR